MIHRRPLPFMTLLLLGASLHAGHSAAWPWSAAAAEVGRPARPQAAEQPTPRPIRNWIFAPGWYTNDPQTGRRLNQYQKIGPVYRVPSNEYYAPDGPHPYGPDYGAVGYNPYFLPLPNLNPFPFHVPLLHPFPTPWQPPAFAR